VFETGRSRAGLKIEGRAAERVGGMAGTGSGGLDMIQREYSRVLTQRTGSPQSLNGRQISRTRLHGHHPVLPVREQAPSKRSCYPRRTRSGGNLASANRGDAPGSEMTDLFFTAHVPTIGAKTAGRWWDAIGAERQPPQVSRFSQPPQTARAGNHGGRLLPEVSQGTNPVHGGRSAGPNLFPAERIHQVGQHE